MLHFEYGDMWRHYKDRVGCPTNDVYASTLTPDFRAMKYDKENRATHFLHRNMDAFRVDSEDELVRRHPFFRLGAFVIVEKQSSSDAKDRERVERKKNLFLVGPTHHAEMNLVTADHITFVVNRGAKKQLQFHKTMYVPNPSRSHQVDPDSVAGAIGRAYRIDNHLTKSFDLVPSNTDPQKWDILVYPASASDPPKREPLISAPDLNDRSHARMFHDVLTRHIRFPDEERSSSSPSVDGGGRRRNTTRRQKKHRDRAFTGFDLSTMFRTLPIEKVVIIAMASDDIFFDVTVFFFDRLRNKVDNSVMEYAFAFKMKESDLRDVETLEIRVASLVHNMTWSNFAS